MGATTIGLVALFCLFGIGYCAVDLTYDSDVCKNIYEATAMREDGTYEKAEDTCASGCVGAGTIPFGGRCLFSYQCDSDNFCDPEQRRCRSIKDKGYAGAECDIKTCDTEEKDLNKCECKNEWVPNHFPNNWVKCTNESEGMDYCDSTKVEDAKLYERNEAKDDSGILTTRDEVVQHVMCFHNKYRQEAGLQPLNWDKSLANFSKFWVDGWKSRSGCGAFGSDASDRTKFDSRLTSVGENVDSYLRYDRLNFGNYIPYYTAYIVTDWYKQVHFYKYSKDPQKIWLDCPNVVGQEVDYFKQMMWKETTKIGCDFEYCESKTSCGRKRVHVSLACHYSPEADYSEGNIFGVENFCKIKNNEKLWIHGVAKECTPGEIDCTPYE